MKATVFLFTALLGACTVDAEPLPADGTGAQPQQEAQQISARNAGIAKVASAEEVEKMEKEIREQRAAIKLRASQTSLPELLEKIKATPEGPERRQLMGEYTTAASYAGAETSAKAMRALDELRASR